MDSDDLNDIMALACRNGPAEIMKLVCKFYKNDSVE